MARRLSDTEKIARDICWCEFTTPQGRAGKTKASYWRGISERSRQELIREAERLVWVMRVLPIDTLNLAHSTRPSGEKRKESMIAKTELEVRLLSVLKRIAHYQTAEQILRSGEKQYGIPGSEALEYAYENIQSEAKRN